MCVVFLFFLAEGEPLKKAEAEKRFMLEQILFGKEVVSIAARREQPLTEDLILIVARAA